jgi:hypothetical protein
MMSRAERVRDSQGCPLRWVLAGGVDSCARDGQLDDLALGVPVLCPLDPLEAFSEPDEEGLGIRELLSRCIRRVPLGLHGRQQGLDLLDLAPNGAELCLSAASDTMPRR